MSRWDSELLSDEAFRINTVTSLVNAAGALLDLANSAQSLIHSYNQSEHSVVVKGPIWDLSVLSDDILATIFEYTAAGDLDGEDVDASAVGLVLSHVNRRFRTLALGIPTLWTYLSNLQHRDEMRTCLERSKDEGLTIDLVVSHNDRDGHMLIDGFLEAVVPHHRRWCELRFESDSCRNEIFDSLRLRCRDLELSSLHHLSLLGIGPHPRDEQSALNTDYSSLHFYSSWNMPNLKELIAHDFIPHEYMDDGRALGPNLSSCTLSVYTEHLYEMDALYEFLRLRPSLQHLTLLFERALCMDLDDKFVELELPNLQSFTVSICEAAACARSDINVFKDFMHSLRLPKLAKMHLSIKDCREEDVPKWLSCLLAPRNDYAHLSEFDVTVWVNSFKPDPYDDIWTRLPNVQHLSIEVPDSVLRFNIGKPHLSQLRSLRLVSCHLTDGECLESLLGRMTQDNGWENFERLEVMDCTMMEEHRGCAELYLPNARIEWTV